VAVIMFIIIWTNISMHKNNMEYACATQLSHTLEMYVRKSQ